MNIGDVVYIYLFDLEKSLINMKELREDRFGKIIDVRELKMLNSSEVVMVYDIQLKDDRVVTYRSDNLTTNMVSLIELIEIIGRADIDSDKRQALLDQLNNVF
jgi:hypothetical protein